MTPSGWVLVFVLGCSGSDPAPVAERPAEAPPPEAPAPAGPSGVAEPEVPDAPVSAGTNLAEHPPWSAFQDIEEAHATCIDADPSQTGLNLCGRDRMDAWSARVAALEARATEAHAPLDVTTAWRAHRDAELAWLGRVYTRDGSMWPMVHAGHASAFLRDRAVELAYDLCEPRPVTAPADDCYSDAIGKYDGFVLCDEAVYDADLNTAYQQLLKASGREEAALLKASQRLWLAHRDVETPACSKMTQEVARTLRVRHRVEQLRRYVEAAEIGG